MFFKNKSTPSSKQLETEFLPATIALRETSASLFPRISAMIITVLWSYFGKIDVTATASGKIIPNSKSKVIQPLQTANIQKILVHEGQAVKAGDLLIQLDGIQSKAEKVKLEHEYVVQLLNKARSKALLDALQHGNKLFFAKPQSKIMQIEDKLYQEALSWLRVNYQEYQDKIQQIQAQVLQKKAEQTSLSAQVSKLKQTLPLLKQQEQDYKILAEDSSVSQHNFLQKKQQSIEQTQDLAGLNSKHNEINAQIKQATAQKNALMSETIAQNFTYFNDASQKIATLEQEIIKINNQVAESELYAPIAGTVQQLSVNTQGGVVTPAQSLMLIVPNNDILEVEAFLANKDIGFIKQNADVVVKVETFPYTKYGSIDGKIISISKDAVQDEKLGLVYLLRIRLLKNHLTDKQNNKITLTAGMAVQADIKTSQRRLIEYFLSPLIEHQTTSFTER
jgi:hemolysin D